MDQWLLTSTEHHQISKMWHKNFNYFLINELNQDVYGWGIKIYLTEIVLLQFPQSMFEHPRYSGVLTIDSIITSFYALKYHVFYLFDLHPINNLSVIKAQSRVKHSTNEPLRSLYHVFENIMENGDLLQRANAPFFHIFSIVFKT